MRKIAFLMALVMLLSVFSVLPASAATKKTYERTIFDRSEPIQINIIIDDATWDNMIATAEDEIYSACDVEVNGKTYKNVAIRPKGNSSLSSVQRSDSERFSWRIKFDKYEKKQTCDGLDVLILNNGFKDPGQLREAIAYDMYAFLEADASLYNYAVVSVNGEYFGCYLALECVDEAFAERNYGEDYGELYKPEIIGLNDKDEGEEGAEDEAAADEGSSSGSSSGEPATDENAENGDASFGGSSGDPATDANGEAPAEGDTEMPAAPSGETEDGSSFGGSSGDAADATAPDENTERPEVSGTEDGSSFGGSSGDAAENDNAGDSAGGSSGGSARDTTTLAMALNYVGDNLDDYYGIWESDKFNSDEEDHQQLVEALKNICAGENIDEYLDVENVLKYLAIQTFIYNHDGLTGNVTHNYYLYEKGGELNLIPWDMNEAFAVSGDGSDYVNFPIDTPFTVSDLSERSFFMALLENEEYLAMYHEYLRQLSEEYALGGEFEKTMSNIRSMIDDLVKDDPTKFCTYEEYEAAASSLTQAVQLRAQSVLCQIEGTIPSTRDGQSAEPEKLLDTSGADFSGLGSGGGMGGGGMPGFGFGR